MTSFAARTPRDALLDDEVSCARKELGASTGKDLVRMLGCESDLPNQVSRRGLPSRRRLAPELTVGREEAAADYSAERVGEHTPKKRRSFVPLVSRLAAGAPHLPHPRNAA